MAKIFFIGFMGLSCMLLATTDHETGERTGQSNRRSISSHTETDTGGAYSNETEDIIEDFPQEYVSYTEDYLELWNWRCVCDCLGDENEKLLHLYYFKATKSWIRSFQYDSRTEAEFLDETKHAWGVVSLRREKESYNDSRKRFQPKCDRQNNNTCRGFSRDDLLKPGWERLQDPKHKDYAKLKKVGKTKSCHPMGGLIKKTNGQMLRLFPKWDGKEIHY